jgi:DNA modification methylase
MKRKYVGIDISEEYCALARERVSRYKGKQRPNSYWENILNKNVASKTIDSFFS